MSVSRQNLRTKRRRRKRQEAWDMEALQREGVGRVLSGVRADGVTVAMARTFCPPSRMPRWWIREDGGPWRRHVTGHVQFRTYPQGPALLMKRETSPATDATPGPDWSVLIPDDMTCTGTHVSPVFIPADGPL